jgi:hypothetical protein
VDGLEGVAADRVAVVGCQRNRGIVLIVLARPPRIRFRSDKPPQVYRDAGRRTATSLIVPA